VAAGGALIAYGATDSVLERYIEEMNAETRRRTPREWKPLATANGAELRVNENRFGSLELEITAVRLLHPDRTPAKELVSGDQLHIEIEFAAARPIQAPIFGISVTRREDGLICYETSTAAAGVMTPTVQEHGQVNLRIDRLDLNGGHYFVDVGAYAQGWIYAYDYHWHAYPLDIRSAGPTRGVLYAPQHWEMKNGASNGASRPVRATKAGQPS
jgi:lipopolysaccharide transport system ATP-binding protein